MPTNCKVEDKAQTGQLIVAKPSYGSITSNTIILQALQLECTSKTQEEHVRHTRWHWGNERHHR